MNLYESRAYIALLSARQLTAKQVGETALIPRSRTYDVLESLTRKGFAQATPSSPHAYAPVPAEKVLSLYYGSVRKKIQDRAIHTNEEAEAKLEEARDAFLTLTKEFAGTRPKEGPIVDGVFVIDNRKNIESTLVGLISDARSEVLRITKPPELSSREPLDPFYIVGLENQKIVFNALKRGIQMKWLSLSREIPTYLGLDIVEPPERRYLDRDQDITEKFLIVDNHSVLLNLHDPRSPGYSQVALEMRSAAVTSIFRDYFDKLWRKGKPLREVLPKMKSLVDDLCAELMEAGLGKTEVALYRTLAWAGAITKEELVRDLGKKRIQPQEALDSCEKMIRLELVHRDDAHRLIMVEHPATVKTSLSEGKFRRGLGMEVTTRRRSGGTNL